MSVIWFFKLIVQLLDDSKIILQWLEDCMIIERCSWDNYQIIVTQLLDVYDMIIWWCYDYFV